MREFKYLDRVKAVEGSVSAIWSEGRTGTVVSTFNKYGENNLLRWDGDTIVFGFNPDNIFIVEKEHEKNEKRNRGVVA